MPASPGHSSAAPSQSRAPASARPASGWSSRAATTIATTAMGTLTTKIHCQAALSTMRPPMIGPKIGPSRIGTPTSASARPTRRGPALCATSVNPTGTSMPPPKPCTTRKAISSPADVAERAQRRADGEQRDRGDPGPLGAEALGDPARERDHRRQRQQVAGRDPLDRAQRGVQVARERVQRDVDDRRVEDRHDEPEGATPATTSVGRSSPPVRLRWVADLIGSGREPARPG